MIAAMDKLLLVGKRRQAEEVLAFLQRLGVVQLDDAQQTLLTLSDDNSGGNTHHGHNAEDHDIEHHATDVDDQQADLGEDVAVALKPLSLQGDAKARQEAQDALLSQSGLLLRDTLGLGDPVDMPLDGSTIPHDIGAQQAYLDELSARVDALLREKSQAQEDLATIDTYLPIYQALAESLAPIEESDYLQGTPVIVEQDVLHDLEVILQEEFPGAMVVVHPYRKDYLLLIVTLKKHQGTLQQLLSREGIGTLELPTLSSSTTSTATTTTESSSTLKTETSAQATLNTMQQKQQTLPERIAEIDQQLHAIGQANKVKLATIHERAKDEAQRYDAMGELLAGTYSFVLSGWVPSRLTQSTVATLQKRFGDDIIIKTQQADPILDTRAPVELQNPEWIQPFEGLLSLFAPPKYGTFDPSWTIAVFFPFYFGLVVGDVGFGLLFAAIGWWLRQQGAQGKKVDLGPLGVTLKPAVLPAVGTVINWCALWSVVFGVLYGEFFGNFLERFPSSFPIFYSTAHHAGAHGEAARGLIPVLLPRVETFTPLLLATIGFGVLQVLGGWAIRAYYAYKHYNTHHLWESIGMLSGLAAVVVFSYGFLTNQLNAFVAGFAALGFTIFLYAVVKSGVLLMLVEIISNSGNILSYLRLFAVGLSAALVANLATDLGFALSGTLPVIGPILGIIVGLAVHLIAMTLTIIGHTLQPLRLQYVEFFTKFGFYEDNGRPYKPLRFLGGKQ